MSGHAKSVLIVEDDAQIRAMLKETLDLEGYATQTAANGAEALAAYEKAPADLVITDIIMPEKEGLGLITDLKRLNPKVRIVAISGGAKDLEAGCNLELAGMFGAAKTFRKPLDLDKLLECLGEMLD